LADLKFLPYLLCLSLHIGRVKEALINRVFSGFQRFSISKKIIAEIVIPPQNNLMQRLEIAGNPEGLDFKHVSTLLNFKKI